MSHGLVFNIEIGVCLILLALLTSSSRVFSMFLTYVGINAGYFWVETKYAHSYGVMYHIALALQRIKDALATSTLRYSRFAPLTIGALLIAILIRVVYHRYIQPVVERFVHKYLRVRVDSNNERQLGRVDYRIENHLDQDSKSASDFFVGLTAKKEKITMSEEVLTYGTQVVGPPGTGKSVLLFNFAIQCIEKGKACCFIDGKGDMNFIHLMRGHFGFSSKFDKFRFFIPTSPAESHSYNPLVSIQDPGELADLLAVGLNLNVPGPGKVYSDTQKAYLLLLFNLFLNTGKKFNFIDILMFTNYPDAREHVYEMVGEKYLVDDMEQFFRRLKPNQPELLGLTTLIQKLFCADAELSRVLNTYASDIVIKNVLEQKQFCLFSLSSGKKAETNEALAKMVIADVSNAVGERMGGPKDQNDFATLILDEFGQYAPTGTFDKFISTARGSNIGCILSHQSNAQLTGRDGVDRLAAIVRECTSTTILFRQAEEADFWARVFGTEEAMKRTDTIEEGDFLTEKRGSRGSLRATEQFLVHPNNLKRLPIGVAAYRSSGGAPEVISIGMFKSQPVTARLLPIHKTEQIGLNLRSFVSGLPKERIEPKVSIDDSSEAPVVQPELQKKGLRL